jgi:tRNA-splicing ligase RtcB (3'-phosphate/5'-hydroxy nucleic acid ligase)
MDLARLSEINPWCYALTPLAGEERAPVRLYADVELLRAMDTKVLEQIANVARLPGLVGAAMTMPDAHWGYGFPIGGVAAFDAEAGGIISAGGVGFDISCGIRCLRSNFDLPALAPRLERLADRLFATIPAGVGEEGEIKLSPDELDRVMRGGARWALAHGYATESDLEYVEEHGCIAGAEPAAR